MKHLYISCYSLSLIACSFGAFASEGDSFNTDFISGKFDRTSVARALDKGINNNAIYAVQVNGRFVGNMYFKHVDNGLVIDDQLIDNLVPVLNEDMLKKLKSTRLLVSGDKDYTFEENTGNSALAIWFSDEVIKRDVDNDMPLAESINASSLNYNISNSYYKNRQTGDSSSSLPFNGHLLLGWGDFPINLDLSSPDLMKEGVSTDNFSVSHLLPGIKSEVTAGQTYTSSRYSEGFSFTGVQMHSVDELLSTRERLYTPTIRGIANSNATVEVYQDQRLLYSKAVAAGAFVIDELQGLSNQTLRVVVKESNGSQHSFFYENTVVPGLLTPGTHDYQVNAGRYRDGSNHLGEQFVSGEYSYGFMFATPTVNTVLSENYRGFTVGAAVPLQILGAVGFSASNSSYTHDGKTDQGQSYGVNYAKYMSNGINIQLAGYRYSTRDYYTFNDAMSAKRQDAGNESRTSGIRNRFTATLTGQEPLLGNQVSFNFLRDQYWRNRPGSTTYSLNYGGYSRYFGYTLSLSKSYSGELKPDTSIALSIDVPIGSGNKSLYTRYNQNGNNNSTEVGVNSYGEHSSYNVAATHSSYNDDNSASASYGLNDDRYSAQLNGSVGSTSLYSAASLSGTLAVADGQLLASSSQSSTMAVVKLKEVQGATVEGVGLQSNGYALVPLNDSYDTQEVSVNLSSVNNNIEIEQSMLSVRPKRGSMVKLDFATKKVKYLKVELLDEQREPLGFGALLKKLSTPEEYYVGNQGGLLLRLEVKDKTELKNIILVNPDSGCRYTIQALAIQKKIKDDFINIGELTCSK